MRNEQNEAKCDGRAGCSCARCRDWEKDAENESYGFQKWLNDKESATKA